MGKLKRRAPIKSHRGNSSGNTNSGQKGSTGVSMGAVERAPWLDKRDAKRRKLEAEKWAARSGEVQVRYVCPVCGGGHSRSDHANGTGQMSDHRAPESC